MMGALQSAPFPGHVTHARMKPKRHRLSYRIYSLLIDLDELEVLDRQLKLFSVDRFNLFSLRRTDRGDRSGSDLKAQVQHTMRAGDIEPDDGPVRVLTMPRLLGWAFNPLSVFFCYGKEGELRAILWGVDNTFGERHGYLIPVQKGDSEEIIQRCDKAFYASPFMDMDLHYQFRVLAPTDRLSIRIDTFDSQGLVLTARHLAELDRIDRCRAAESVPHHSTPDFEGRRRHSLGSTEDLDQGDSLACPAASASKAGFVDTQRVGQPQLFARKGRHA